MNKWKILVLISAFLSIQNLPLAQTSIPRPIIEIKGPKWISGTQSVVTCKRIGDNEDCVTSKVPTAFGDMIGILRLKPIRNATTSWLAFTKKAIVVCGMQFSNKKIVCAPVNESTSDLPLYYPKTREQLVDTVKSFEQFQPSFSAAGKQVANALAPVGKKIVGEVSTMSDREDGSDCGDGCDEDMPIVYVDGPSPGDSGGGGWGDSGWGDWPGGNGGPRTPPDNIDPETGLPIQQVFVYPPPPKWPTDVSWCSLTGLFCAKTTEITPPSPEACERALKICYEECTSIYVFNPEHLPGSGPDYPSRYRVCVRQCMGNHGCKDY